MLPSRWSQPACRNMLVTRPRTPGDRRSPDWRPATTSLGTAPHVRNTSLSASSPPWTRIHSSQTKTALHAATIAIVMTGVRRGGIASRSGSTSGAPPPARRHGLGVFVGLGRGVEEAEGDAPGWLGE